MRNNCQSLEGLYLRSPWNHEPAGIETPPAADKPHRGRKRYIKFWSFASERAFKTCGVNFNNRFVNRQDALYSWDVVGPVPAIAD